MKQKSLLNIVIFSVCLIFISFSGQEDRMKVSINHKSENVKASILIDMKNVIIHSGDSKEYYWYLNNDIHSTVGAYSGKLLDGPFEVFYLNSALKEKGTFRNGLKHGIFIQWLPNGKIKSSYSFKEGLKCGPFFTCDSIGNTLMKGEYKKDVLHGKIYYFDNDSLRVRYFNEGKEVENKKNRNKKKPHTATEGPPPGQQEKKSELTPNTVTTIRKDSVSSKAKKMRFGKVEKIRPDSLNTKSPSTPVNNLPNVKTRKSN